MFARRAPVSYGFPRRSLHVNGAVGNPTFLVAKLDDRRAPRATQRDTRDEIAAAERSDMTAYDSATSTDDCAMTDRTLYTYFFVCAVLGCNSSPAAQQPPQRPPPEVGVVTLKTEAVTLQTELAGRTAASLASELRPQVTGIVKARTFEEGARVNAGQVLYQIDPAMYRAAFEEAKANLASAQATLASATLKDERFAELLKIEGVSKQEADDARAGHQLATAGVAQKEA